MASKLIDLEVFEVTLCRQGANKASKVALFKMDTMEGKKESAMKQEEFDAAVAKAVKDDKTVKQIVEHLQESRKEVDKQLEESKAEIETLKALHDDEEDKKKNKKEKDKKAMDDLPDSVKKEFALAKEETDTLRKKNEETEARLAKMEDDSLQKQMEELVSEYPRTYPSVEKQEEAIKMFKTMTPEVLEFTKTSLEQSEIIAGKADSIFKETGSSQAITGGAVEKIQTLAEDLIKEDPAIRIDVARTKVRASNPDLAKAEREEVKGD